MAVSALALGAVAAGVAVASGVTSQVGKLVDVFNSPTQLKSLGNYENALLNNSNVPYIEKYVIDDYEQVAMTYERTGYRVDKVYNDIYLQKFNEFVKDLLTRHYYNPIQFGNVELYCDANISQEMRDNFGFRLKNGIRFWNTDNGSIGDYRYDNVEEKYL